MARLLTTQEGDLKESRKEAVDGAIDIGSFISSPVLDIFQSNLSRNSESVLLGTDDLTLLHLFFPF